jgi:hypothetical protein
VFPIKPDPLTKSRFYRALIKHHDLTEEKRLDYQKEIDRYEKWRVINMARAKEFCTINDEEYSRESALYDFELAQKILALRRQEDVVEPVEEFKEATLNDFYEYERTMTLAMSSSIAEVSVKPVEVPKPPPRKEPKERTNIPRPPDERLRYFNRYFETVEGAAFLKANPPVVKAEEPLAELQEIDPRDIP